MNLNWDTLLNAESLNMPNDPWSDLLPPTSAYSTSQMPNFLSNDTSGSSPEDNINFDCLLNNTSDDPYFDDSLFMSNDHFPGELEVLQPFSAHVVGGASTSESSPEPSTGPVSQSSSDTPASLGGSLHQSPQVSSTQKLAIQHANTFPHPALESLFQNNLGSGVMEDLSFPAGPKGQQVTKTSAKRSKNKPDILSACWTSPLCPNHDQDGPPPNPSTCGGECAPFLFANDDALPINQNLLAEPHEVNVEEGVVEIQTRLKKRTESNASSNDLTGRYFKTNASSAQQAQRLKSETSEDSPAKETLQASDDQKPKSRKRLPHNQVERKYRESLNTQLESLRRVVPSLQQNHGPCEGADIEDLSTPSKPSKAVILASATAYIKQMDKDKKVLADENQLLRARVKALQALVKCDDCSLMQYFMDMKVKQAA
ncbi:hypothetical protein ACN47E_006216 [Coniothyrium glycines]